MLDVALTVLALAASHGPAAQPQPLELRNAAAAARYDGQELAVAFTEHKPHVTVDCRRTGRMKATCRVRVHGDRIHVSYVDDVILDSEGDYGVYAHSLHVLR